MLKVFRQLIVAFGWLTRLPVMRLVDHHPEKDHLQNALWAFPLVGAVTGLVTGWVIYALFALLGLPSIPAVALGVGISILLTGALHEDGFADMLDGSAAGGNRIKRLRIMRDSSLGTYGVLGLIIMVIAKIFLIEYILIFKTKDFFLIMVMMGILSRAAIPFALYGFATKDKESSAAIQSLGIIQPVIALWIALIPLYFWFPLAQGLLSLIAAAILIIGFGIWAKKRLGGITGDICGGLIICIEIIILIIFNR